MQLVIFDCDGTIADSQHIIVAAMNEAFRRTGLPEPAREDVVRIIGLSLVPAVQSLLPEAMHDRAIAIADDYKAAFHDLRASGAPHEPLFPGMKAAITRLKADGATLGIATGKSVRGVRLLLEREGLVGVFSTVQTADTHPSKPHPSMIETAMAETGASPRETVMIGDTVYDVLMAVNAGVQAVGVAWGYHSVADLHDAGAHIIVHDASEMLSALAWLQNETAS